MENTADAEMTDDHRLISTINDINRWSSVLFIQSMLSVFRLACLAYVYDNYNDRNRISLFLFVLDRHDMHLHGLFVDAQFYTGGFQVVVDCDGIGLRTAGITATLPGSSLHRNHVDDQIFVR